MSQASQDTTLVVARPLPKARGILRNRDRLVSIALITPSIVAIAIFVYGFIAQTAYVSMVRWNDFTPDFTWVGLRNYERLFQNQRFQIDMGNTFIFTAGFITSCLLVGLVLAAILDQKIKG